LLSALVGLAAGGGMIWIVRFVGTAARRREAMGFGDVMLMSMIGAFLGWQGVLLVFFLGPFFGLVGGLVQWAVHRQNELPYGPYLCLAALLVILRWPAMWNWGYDFFAMGGLLMGVLALCLVMMGCMLWIYRLARERFLAS
jgi:prepilin signal peptidase PulO-like enzyme (type II secretory pathway)